MTPAQASPERTDFVTDVATQGPTDQGLRENDCWFARNRLPARPACADCEGPIPMHRALLHSQFAGVGEQISFGGRPVHGFGIVGMGAAGSPDIWPQLSQAQQTWVGASLVKLNDLIVKATGTTCATFGPSITAAGGCFQHWYNTNYLPINPGAVQLRTDGVFDEDTLCALLLMAKLHPNDFPTSFPDPENRYCQAPVPAPTPEEKKKLSTGAMVGIGAAGLAGVAGIIYAATQMGGRKKKTRRKARRRR